MLQTLWRAVQLGSYRAFGIQSAVDPFAEFHGKTLRGKTERCLEHLASLQIDVSGCSVLDVGAGIGDFAPYYLERGSRVTLSDAREQNVAIAHSRFPQCEARVLDLETATALGGEFDVIHCYGVLYHLSNPARAIDTLARHCKRFLLCECVVSQAEAGGDPVHPLPENKGNPSQSFSGVGCRPDRAWLFAELRKHFPYVYTPVTQPNHPQYPIDWSVPLKSGNNRSVFIASREPLQNPLLTTELPLRQCRDAATRGFGSCSPPKTPSSAGTQPSISEQCGAAACAGTRNTLFREAADYSLNDAERLRLLYEQAVLQARRNEGDMLELGVCRGGTALLLAQATRLHAPARRVHLLDSWQGLPEPGPEDSGTIASQGLFAESTKDEVVALLSRHGVQGVCSLYEGWFADTLPGIPGPFSLVHVDCDFYEAVRHALRIVLPRMSANGVILVDDVGTQESRRFPGVFRAVTECLEQEGRGWRVRMLGGERDQSALMERIVAG